MIILFFTSFLSTFISMCMSSPFSFLPLTSSSPTSSSLYPPSYSFSSFSAFFLHSLFSPLSLSPFSSDRCAGIPTSRGAASQSDQRSRAGWRTS